MLFDPKDAKAFTEFASVRWTRYGSPVYTFDSLKEMIKEFYGITDKEFWDFSCSISPELYDQYEQFCDITIRALDTNFFIPKKPNCMRINHTFGLNHPDKEREEIVRGILKDGLVPDPTGRGRFSECPSAVFAVVDNPEAEHTGKYNKSFPWVTADLPFEELSSWDRDMSPGSVFVCGGIHLKYIVGINGLPIESFRKALNKYST